MRAAAVAAPHMLEGALSRRGSGLHVFSRLGFAPGTSAGESCLGLLTGGECGAVYVERVGEETFAWSWELSPMSVRVVDLLSG